MNVQAPFGFVTGCHAGDKFMVQATLASIKHFCPDVPICLIVDGTHDVSDLEDVYGLIILRISDLPDEQMRRTIGANYRAKLAAMWEGPFDFYVWLDSDAIVWGDFVPLVRRDLDFHIFWKEAQQSSAPPVVDGIRHFYFDPDKLMGHDPTFEWRGNTYFCSGAFACRRNVITFIEWLEIEEWGRKTKGLFAWGEMGMLNYLVHAKAQRREIQVASSDLQHVWAHHGKDELIRDTTGCGLTWPKLINRPRIAHFCYRKPWTFDAKSYSKPFTLARFQHFRKVGYSKVFAGLKIIMEDTVILFHKVSRRIRRLLLQ